MATTGFWPVKANLLALIKYTENPEKTSAMSENEMKALHNVLDYDINGDKTEQKLYVTGINCLPETAYERMMATKLQFNKTGGVLASMLIRALRREKSRRRSVTASASKRQRKCGEIVSKCL